MERRMAGWGMGSEIVWWNHTGWRLVPSTPLVEFVRGFVGGKAMQHMSLQKHDPYSTYVLGSAGNGSVQK